MDPSRLPTENGQRSLPLGPKRIARALLELPLLSVVRLMFVQSEARRERRRVLAASRRMGLPILTGEIVESLAGRKPEAHIAFILGTGASAARLSQEKLEIIQSQFSIGINQWIFHSLIPDLYAYEVDERLSLLQALDRAEIRSAAPPILFLRPRNREAEGNAMHLPEFLKSRTYVYGRINLWTRKVGNIAHDFTAAMRITKAKKKEFLAVDDGASIVRMVALCSALGFERIVLVGVDLNNVKYFWDEDPSFLERHGLSDFDAGQTGKIHETMSSVSRPFGVDVFIAAMAEMLKQRGITLEVESSASELAKSIPVARW